MDAGTATLHLPRAAFPAPMHLRTPVLAVLAVLVAAGASGGTAAGASAQDFPVSAATYLGGAGDDDAAGVDLLPDGTVVVAATAAGLPPGIPTVAVAGGGAGVVLRLTSDGRRALGAVRVGTAVTDVEAGPDGRVAVAAQGVGPVVLDGDALVWLAPLPTVARVARAADGTVAALTSGKTVVVYDGAGTELGRRTFADSFVEDVAVDAATGLVFVTGYNNKNTGQEPIQVAFVRAFTRDMAAQRWRNYDWAGSVGRAEQSPNVADSRGYRVAMGRDGQLYFGGESHGGNTTFFYDPQQVSVRLGADRLVAYDAYTTGYNTASNPLTVVGRFDPATGAVDRIQLVLGRLPSTRGNTVRPRGITADAAGRVYVAGAAAAYIQGRDGTAMSVGGQPLAVYSGFEAFLLVVAPDFRSREAWTAFSAGGPHASTGTGVAVRGAALALTATAETATTQFVTANALQAARGAGTKGYVVVRGPQPVSGDAWPDTGTADGAALRVRVIGSPARTAVRVEVSGDDVAVTLVDALGRTVRALTPGVVDVSGLAPGVYHVRAEGGGRVAAAPLVVVR